MGAGAGGHASRTQAVSVCIFSVYVYKWAKMLILWKIGVNTCKQKQPD